LGAICSSGAKATIYVGDTRDQSAIGVIQHGFSARQMVDYEQRYAKINPWGPLLMKFSALRAFTSDEQLRPPASATRSFYRLSLRESADQLGIAYHHTALRRSQNNAATMSEVEVRRRLSLVS
jgi:hypothetical protein